MERRLEEALVKARAQGHELEADPPLASAVWRHTCKQCGCAVLVGDSGTYYGSAITTRCTEPDDS